MQHKTWLLMTDIVGHFHGPDSQRTYLHSSSRLQLPVFQNAELLSIRMHAYSTVISTATSAGRLKMPQHKFENFPAFWTKSTTLLLFPPFHFPSKPLPWLALLFSHSLHLSQHHPSNSLSLSCTLLHWRLTLSLSFLPPAHVLHLFLSLSTFRVPLSGSDCLLSPLLLEPFILFYTHLYTSLFFSPFLTTLFILLFFFF